MVKVSIVVPVHNVEKYIRKCLDSIIAQTLTDWECILVDDGSPDNCGKICDEYAEKDHRFHVYHTENRGVSAARNLGLSKADADWISFVDPDDYLPSEALDIMYREVKREDVDIFIGCESTVNQGKQIKKDKYKEGKFDNEAYSLLVTGCKVNLTPHGKLYRKSVLQKSDIQIDRTITIGEDGLMNFFILPLIKKVFISNDLVYFYTVRENSASHKVFPFSYWEFYLDYLTDNYKKYKLPESYYLRFKSYKLWILMKLYPNDFILSLGNKRYADICAIRNYCTYCFTQKYAILTCKTRSILMVNFVRILSFCQSFYRTTLFFIRKHF